ncbi:MAG: DinB family protein [Terriglobales bacterium]
MTESKRIADQLHRAYAGGAWHGPALRELLADVTAKQAAARPVTGAHGIWEIVLHITAWKKAVHRKLKGYPVELAPRQDWPPVGKASAAAWRKTLKALEKAHRELEKTVARLPESRLKEVVPGRKHTVYFMLHGLVQHDLYHAGQIALLKKAKR